MQTEPEVENSNVTSEPEIEDTNEPSESELEDSHMPIEPDLQDSEETEDPESLETTQETQILSDQEATVEAVQVEHQVIPGPSSGAIQGGAIQVCQLTDEAK